MSINNIIEPQNNRMVSTGLIGGEFIRSNDLKCFSKRTDLFELWYAEKELSNATLPDTEITITLPNGDIKQGFAFKTTPLDIANSISKGLAESIIILHSNLGVSSLVLY